MNKLESQKKLIDIWQDLLHHDHVIIDQDFYALGGNSFLAIQLLFSIKRDMGIDIPSSKIMQRPLTIEHLIKIMFNSIAQTSQECDKIDKKFYIDMDYVKYSKIVWSKLKKTNANNIIFLTGANGFVGTHILDTLLCKTNYQIYCLVRGGNEDIAADRLQKSMSFFKLSKLNKRVKVFCGDLTKFNFGLSNKKYDILAKNVDIIIHAGAQVNFEMEYDLLRSSNVHGTLEVLRLSSMYKPKQVHHISSLAVFSGLKEKKAVLKEERDVKTTPLGVYAQTKLLAEKNIIFGMKKGLQAVIYRLGEVAPSTKTGMPNTKSLYHTFILAFKDILAYPGKSGPYDYIPVDFIADFIVETIVCKNDVSGKIFHLCHPRGLYFDDIMLSFGDSNIKSMAIKKIIKYVRQQFPRTPQVAILKLFIENNKLSNKTISNPFDFFFLKGMSNISMKNTIKQMDTLHLSFPTINKMMISKYIKYCMKSIVKKYEKTKK